MNILIFNIYIIWSLLSPCDKKLILNIKWETLENVTQYAVLQSPCSPFAETWSLETPSLETPSFDETAVSTIDFAKETKFFGWLNNSLFQNLGQRESNLRKV